MFVMLKIETNEQAQFILNRLNLINHNLELNEILLEAFNNSQSKFTFKGI